MKRTGQSVFALRKKLALEYLSAPLHIIVAAMFVRLLGDFRSKVLFDQVRRRQHAFGILEAADIARSQNVAEVTVIEFGVASGAGLMNMAQICRAVTKLTGVRFKLVGFDTGGGLPQAVDHRDHPEMFVEGDYPTVDMTALRDSLPPFASLVLGDVKETVPEFVKNLDGNSPIGYISFDLDYYSSTKDAFEILLGSSEFYLPVFWVYFDDVSGRWFNDWCGELLAIQEFNDTQAHRKLHHNTFLKTRRFFKNAEWIDMMRTVHVLDHPVRSVGDRPREAKVIGNAALSIQNSS